MIKIRKAETGDTPALETLFLITRQRTFHWESPDKFKLEDFQRSTAGETILVAEDENAIIVGFISVWEQDTIPFIHHLFIAPNYQRKGIGTLLMQSLLTRSPPPYRLKCVTKNKDALAFYQKNGWIEIGKGVGEDGDYLLLELSHNRGVLLRVSLKKIFFLIGASGSGKTTATKELEKRGLANFKILYFDSIGVPSTEEMEAKYGGPEEWQKSKTIEWVRIIKKDFLPVTHVLFDGQTRPSFIEQACHENEIKEFEVILFDCSDDERKRRLVARGQASLADENMMNWARYLRRECQDRGYGIIDNTSMQIEGTVSQLLAYLHELAFFGEQ